MSFKRDFECPTGWCDCASCVHQKGFEDDGTAICGFTSQKVYICLPHCAFFRGEDGCGHNGVDETARYEMDGDYPLCPLYIDREGGQ